MDTFRRCAVIGSLISFLLLQLLLIASVLEHRLPFGPATDGAPAVQQPQDEDPYVGTRRAEASYRLRKLHMVRPDLIPYPIAIEVYA